MLIIADSSALVALALCDGLELLRATDIWISDRLIERTLALAGETDN